MKEMPRPVAAHVVLLAVVLVWGSTFVLVKDALAGISPLLFNFLRLAAAFLVLAAVYWKHLKTINRRILAQGSLVGLCLGMGYQFQTEGLKLTTPSKSAFITGLAVAMVPVLLLFPWLRAKASGAPKSSAFLGSVAALVGLALLTLPPHAPWRSFFSGMNRGGVLTLAGAFFFALQIVALAKYAKDVRFEHMGLIQVGAAALLMAGTGPIFESAKLVWSPTVIFALAVTAVLGTSAAFTAQSFAQEILPATTVVLIMALEPVFAGIFSYLFYGERLGPRQISGALLVIAGIIATELLPKLSRAPRNLIGLPKNPTTC
ncbi:MAG TPA: DMT family transporter [Elusimicrobiota bacterium]|nr:DMT family transporter [Elusimicrobiota bacterium]